MIINQEIILIIIFIVIVYLNYKLKKKVEEFMISAETHIKSSNEEKTKDIYTDGLNNFNIIYYINLAHRKDRLTNIINELNKTNIDSKKINRIPGIYIKDFGSLGCAKSHCLALESFLKSHSDNKYCIIFEDDFQFTQEQNIINVICKYFKWSIL